MVGGTINLAYAHYSAGESAGIDPSDLLTVSVGS